VMEIMALPEVVPIPQVFLTDVIVYVVCAVGDTLMVIGDTEVVTSVVVPDKRYVHGLTPVKLTVRVNRYR